jgi:orotate phosphoribosyltransferase
MRSAPRIPRLLRTPRLPYTHRMPNAKRIAEFLLSIGAVKLSPENPYTWTSGIKSPIYCDNRMIYSHPEARTFVAKALADRVGALHIPADVVAGTATAAIGWAALVADRLNLPFVYVRSKAKEHGTQKLVEGMLAEGKDVVLIEDLLSTGGSAMRSVQALRDEGKANVHDVVSIFSYEFLSAAEKADESSVKLHPLCTLSTLLDVAIEQGRIDEAQRKLVADFAREPEAWHLKR